MSFESASRTYCIWIVLSLPTFEVKFIITIQTFEYIWISILFTIALIFFHILKLCMQAFFFRNLFLLEMNFFLWRILILNYQIINHSSSIIIVIINIRHRPTHIILVRKDEVWNRLRCIIRSIATKLRIKSIIHIIIALSLLIGSHALKTLTQFIHWRFDLLKLFETRFINCYFFSHEKMVQLHNICMKFDAYIWWKTFEFLKCHILLDVVPRSLYLYLSIKMIKDIVFLSSISAS